MLNNFEQLAGLADHDIDLIQAALFIAQREYPDLDVPTYLAQIDAHAKAVQHQLNDATDAEHILETLNNYLFKQQGFSGNLDDYYDPRNSLLNDVLDRKSGIPISLSIIYMEIGKRLGLDLEGVCFPGHFLVRFNVAGGAIVLDPFFGGMSLDETELYERLEQHVELETDESLEDYLAPASNKAILVRLLRNLRVIHIQKAAAEKALHYSDWIIRLTPDNADEYLMRGKLYQQLDCYLPALKDYQHYLHMDVSDDEAERVRAEVIRLQHSDLHIH
ncbi:MAG: tetratricopeptide repeat protein [Gammaproteobacteria bacterium]|nr:tetratricopeptide repeat protein [Gammaproteobacteria bacterium]